MKVSALTIYLAALPLSWSSPTAPDLISRHESDCIPTSEANSLLKKFVKLFEKLDVSVAKKILVPDFAVQSASLNFLYAKGPGLTTSSREEFINTTLISQQNNPTSKIIILDADHTCNKIYFRWRNNDTDIRSLYGFDEVILTHKPDGWKIKKDYSEFNNAIVLYDAGLFPCTANNTPTPGT